MIGVSVLGWDIAAETVITGATTGLVYAVLGAGLVLVYRATRVVNFAYGEIGALGAAILAELVLDQGWNFFLALPAVLAVGGALGAAIELGVIRRLFRAPRLIVLVATIGVAQLVFVLQLILPGIERTARYPTPIDATLDIGGVQLRSEHFMVMVFAPAVIAAIGYLLTRTRHGIAIRAAAENADRAELVGISTKRVSTTVWVVAGVLATLTAVLVNPLRGTIVGIPTQALGPSLLLRALASGLVGGMVSLPRTLVGGVVVGVVEAVIFVNVRTLGAADAVLFVAVLLLVLLRRGTLASDEEGSWSLTPRVKAVPARLAELWWVPRLNLLVALGALVLALLLPLVFTSASQLFLFSRVLLYAIAALSVTVLIGWAGQLSLGQMAFGGVGAFVTAGLVTRGMPFGLAIGYATVAGVAVALFIGFPALRVRGLFLAVTTLAFALAARGWLFTRPALIGDSALASVTRGEWLGIDFRSERVYYYVCLLALVASVFVVWRLRASGIGRAIVAVRDNERAAAAATISPAAAKLTAFAVAGGLAALAGALLGGLRVQFGADAFPPEESLRVVAMTVIGGLGSIGGAVLGAVYVIGLPALFGHNATVGLATSGIGLLLLLLYLPGGLVQMVHRARDAVLAALEQRLPSAAAPDRPARTRVTTAPRHDHPADGVNADVPALRAVGITVDFGGRRALDDVTVEAQPGEIVGLIGSNGAGKSTLMNVVSGFVTPSAGVVELFGTDVTALPSHDRAAKSVGRVFQDARLFGDLTVRETVQVALEAHAPSELVPSLLGLAPSRRAEAAKAADAAAHIAFLGLDRYADAFVADLSTGTRRIVELCCLLAQGARLLLLDEPTAGVAQRETEAFGPLIKRIQQELGATVLIIEHDIPLVMSLSDRVYCLAAGQCIAEGLPEDVRHDPRVVAAYLGTDERAIERSGAAAEGLH